MNRSVWACVELGPAQLRMEYSFVCLPIWASSLNVFPKSTLSNRQVYIAFWLFFEVCIAKLQIPHYPIVEYMLPSPQSEVANSTLSSCQVHFIPVNCLNELQAAHNFFNFWAAHCLNLFFMVAPPPAPPSPTLLPCAFSHFIFSSLNGSLRLEREREPSHKFKLHFESNFWTYRGQFEKFQVQISYFLCLLFYEWYGVGVILMEWKFIHENSENLRMK
jgi:hypothetical protein